MRGGEDVHQISHVTANIGVASGLNHETDEEVGAYEAIRERERFCSGKGVLPNAGIWGGGAGGRTIRKAYAQRFFGSECPDGPLSVDGSLGDLEDSGRSLMSGIVDCFVRRLWNMNWT